MSIRSYPSNSLFAYATKGKAAVFTAPASKQIAAYNLRAANNSGGSANVGLLKKLFNTSGQSPSYSIYQYTDATTTGVEVTNAIAAGTNTTVFTTTNNDGFIVAAKAHFNLVGITIGTARSGLTVTYSYWNGAAWASLTTLEVPAWTSATDVWAVFQSPIDWVKGATTTGVNANFYPILVKATAAGSGVVAASSVWVGKFLEFYEGVANNGMVQLSFPDSKPLAFEAGEAFMPYFSVTNAANQAGAYYSLI